MGREELTKLAPACAQRRDELTKLALAYAQHLVKIESVTFHERECAEELARILGDLGFETELDDGNNLVARLRGTHSGAPCLLFIGHHDTVALGDLEEWDYPPLSAVVENGKLHGRGSNDEKGGLAAFLAAVDYMKARGARPRGDILLISTREEIADLDRRGILQVLRRHGIGPAPSASAAADDSPTGAAGCCPAPSASADSPGPSPAPATALRADACICLEPTETKIMLGHRGRAVTDFTVRGRAAHASMPARGVNAIEKAAALIDALRKMPLPGEGADWTGTQAVTTIRGGAAENIVAEECHITVDRRILDGEDEHSVAAEYRAVIDGLHQQDEDFQADFQVRPPYYAALTDREEGFVQEMQRICREVGAPSEPEIFPGHTDAEWVINDMAIPCVIFGPGSLSTAHTAREYVPVADLGICAEVYYRAMQAFAE